MVLGTERQADSRATHVQRRVLLGTVGSVLSLGTLGTLGYATRPPIETLAVRVWFSDAAASYDAVTDRVLEYLGELLAYDHWQLELSAGGVVTVSTEDGARVTNTGEWPSMIAAGGLGAQDLEPATGVNVLVTDGQITTTPTGFAVPHVASVGGARYLADLPPIDDLATPARDADPAHRIVRNSRSTRAIQLLLHEIGHALGLDHEHGVVFRDGDAVVATPMLSSYAWDPEYDGDRSQCGTRYASVGDRDRRLSLTFSDCAQRALAEYGGGLVPRRLTAAARDK